jgi:hypothetical protein
MSTDRNTQRAQIRAAERKRIVSELNQMAADMARCERTIDAVMKELNAVNAKYQGPRTTRQDVEYLTVLLDCAKRKLAWEKQIGSLRKRVPALLESMTGVMNDKEYPPSDDLKVEMLRSLQTLQGALERLHGGTEVSDTEASATEDESAADSNNGSGNGDGKPDTAAT